MKAGRLRHRVEIQEAVETKNELGEPVAAWKTIATVSASIEPLSGRELIQARQVMAETTHRIGMRYFAGLHPKNRLKFGDRIFGIENILTPREIKHEHEILCREEV